MASRISPEKLKQDPWRYDSCPRCGKPKTKSAAHCRYCMSKILTGKNHHLWKGGREENKKRAKIYRQSERGKTAQKAWNQSEKGKAAGKAWRQSEKGKARIKIYQQSKKGKIRQKAYAENEKGKAVRLEIPAIILKRYPHMYDSCPRCGKPKSKSAAHCFSCRCEILSGENHHGWKGGAEKRKERAKIYRQTEEYKTARKNHRENHIDPKQNFILNFKAQIGCQHDSCPENNPFLLQFHHPNGRQKDEKHLSSTRSWEEIFRIFKECDLFCCNHHQLEHSEKLIGVQSMSGKS